MVLALQKIQCGVPGTLWEPYDATLHWMSKKEPDPFHVLLCDKVTYIAFLKKYAVKKPNGTWIMIDPITRAIADTNQYWGHLITLAPIKDKDGNVVAETASQYAQRQHKYVSAFVNSMMLSIENMSSLPIVEEFITIDGVGECLNKYRDETLPYEYSVDMQMALPILRMIKYSLCSEDLYSELRQHGNLLKDAGQYDEAEYTLMVEQLLSGDNSNFRWVIHWLSRIRQNIGIVSGVALVMHGPSTGIGKGTLNLLMSSILGANMCKPVKADDFGRKWTDGAIGGIWINADDWDNGELKKYEDLLKQFITNDVCAVYKRNVGQMKMINTASWYITNNEVDPIAVDDNERRYTIINTTSDQDMGRVLAATVYNASVKQNNDWTDMVTGFNNLLCSVPVDVAFVSLPLENEHREELKEMNKNVVLIWLESVSGALITEQSFTGLEMYEKFNEWHINEMGTDTSYRMTGFGRELLNHTSICNKKRVTVGIVWTITPNDVGLR